MTEGPAVSLSVSTRESVGPQPLVRDPYERTVCQVRSSQLEAGGEGLFAVRNIARGEIVAFYNGVRYNTTQYNTIQYNTIQYNTIQYNTIQYNTLQYNTIQRLDYNSDLNCRSDFPISRARRRTGRVPATRYLSMLTTPVGRGSTCPAT